MNTRKANRLKEYDYSRPGAYFVTICLADRRALLGSVVGADDHIGPQIRLSTIGETVEKYLRGIKGIDKYVVMPNHLHMIIKIENDGPMWSSAPTNSIPQRIKTFKTLVAKELGRSVFQRSYHDHIIRNEEDYLQIWKYIDENPAKWESDPFYRK